MRQAEVRMALKGHCKGCSSDCTRAYLSPLLDRAEWPVCPMALLEWPWWRRLVSRFVAAEISPLEGWPEAYPAVVVDAFLAIRMAQRAELKRQAQAPKGPALPHFEAGPLSGDGL